MILYIFIFINKGLGKHNNSFFKTANTNSYNEEFNYLDFMNGFNKLREYTNKVPYAVLMNDKLVRLISDENDKLFGNTKATNYLNTIAGIKVIEDKNIKSYKFLTKEEYDELFCKNKYPEFPIIMEYGFKMSDDKLKYYINSNIP